MKSALVTGITGQDGAYLAEFLLKKGYHVVGIHRRLSSPNFWRLKARSIYDDVEIVEADMTDLISILRVFRLHDFDEVYNLAAQSFVGTSFHQPIVTLEVNATGTLRILEAARIRDTGIKVYQASTSELYGNSSSGLLDESTPFAPASPYAISKLYAYWITRNYRDAYSMYAVNGILFNHESPLRGLEFITRKVTNAVARIKLDLQEKLSVGNIHSSRDWGYAPEYIEAMWLMLQQDDPDDFVIATGEKHTVGELIETAFNQVGLNSSDYVETSTKYMRPSDVECLLGNASKAETKLGWKPKTLFKQLVKIMVDEDLSRWKKHLSGEIVLWDAGNS